MGWCFCDLRDDSYFEKMCQQIQTWKDYVDCSNVYYDYVDQSVKSLHDEVNAGDVIWMRSEGRYYFARTVNESKWQFNHEARNIDAANQLTHVNWKEVKDVSPISESLRRQFEVLGPTFRRIQKQDIWDFTLKMLRGQEK